MVETEHDNSIRPFSVYWALLFGLATFSLSPILVRLASEGPALAIVTWRTLIAMTAVAPFALGRTRAEMRDFAQRDILLIGCAGVLLGLHFVTWTESLYHTSVASASVLVTSSPIFLAVLGHAFLKERLSRHMNVAIAVAVVGAALLGLGDVSGAETPAAPVLGNSLALLSALLFSVYLLFGRVVRRKTSWLAYVFPLYAVTAATVLVAALILKTELFGYSIEFYTLCAAIAIGPQVVGHGSFNYAIRYFPAAVLGLLSLVEPVGASALAYVLFAEMPNPLSLVGIIVTLLAIASAILYRRTHRNELPIGTD